MEKTKVIDTILNTPVCDIEKIDYKVIKHNHNTDTNEFITSTIHPNNKTDSYNEDIMLSISSDSLIIGYPYDYSNDYQPTWSAIKFEDIIKITIRHYEDIS